MVPVIALLLSIQGAPAAVSPAGPNKVIERAPIAESSATAGVRVMRSVRIDPEDIELRRSAAIQTRRDAAGTIWVEFT